MDRIILSGTAWLHLCESSSAQDRSLSFPPPKQRMVGKKHRFTQIKETIESSFKPMEPWITQTLGSEISRFRKQTDSYRLLSHLSMQLVRVLFHRMIRLLLRTPKRRQRIQIQSSILLRSQHIILLLLNIPLLLDILLLLNILLKRSPTLGNQALLKKKMTSVHHPVINESRNSLFIRK